MSGSPNVPHDGTRYRLNLDRVDGMGKQAGFMFYCCWPCVCDTQDFIRVDTKTIKTADGPREYNVAVIGNPCSKPEELTRPFTQPFGNRQTTIAHSAPEVKCGRGGVLEGSTLSDNGYVIVSLFFDASKRTSGFQDEANFKDMCEDRKTQGYNSGMGEIFRKVAAIAPVKIMPPLLPPAKMTVKQMRVEAARLNLDTRGITEKAELVTLLKQAQAKKIKRMTVKELRAEATRLNLNLRGIIEKAELMKVLTDSLVVSTPVRSANAKSESPHNGHDELSPVNLTMMRTRELQKEASRRGLITRGIVDRSDLLALLQQDVAERCSAAEKPASCTQ